MRLPVDARPESICESSSKLGFRLPCENYVTFWFQICQVDLKRWVRISISLLHLRVIVHGETRMKFGILQFFSWPDRRISMPTVYERALQRIEVMDQAAYDAVWLTEHHFNDYSVCPSIPVMGAYAAARTRRLRIGAGVTLAAFYHPLRLAEEIALLDILSGGRVNWGAGRGFDAREFGVFGIPVEESRARFREAVDIVVSAWVNDRVTYRGRYFSFEDIE